MYSRETTLVDVSSVRRTAFDSGRLQKRSRSLSPNQSRDKRHETEVCGEQRPKRRERSHQFLRSLDRGWGQLVNETKVIFCPVHVQSTYFVS